MRCVRLAVGVRALQRASDLWADLEQDAGERLLHLTGGLYLGPANSTVAPRKIALIRSRLSA